MERYSLDDLRWFLTVARHRSFVHAAAELRTPPSTLSRRIASLETSIGQRLLERTSRRVSLTHEGEELLARAGPLLEEAVRATDAALSGARAPRGTVRVTAPVVSGAEWVSAVLLRLAKRHPDLRIELRLTNEVVSLVDARIDVAVRAGPLAPSRFVARRLQTFSYSFFAAATFVERRLGGVTHVTTDELAALPGILLRDGGAWRLKPMRGPTRKIAPSVRFVVNDPRVALEAAAEGLGVVCASEDMAKRHGPALVKLRCAGYAIEPRSLYVVTPAKKAMPPRTRVVVDALVEEARSSRSQHARADSNGRPPA